MTKSYLTATNIPEWAATHAGTSSTPRWRKFVLHTAFAAPLLTLVVSAPAMLAEPLRWSDQSARDAQSTSFIISGLLMFASMQPLTQAFLDGGLIAWYEVKEGTERERLTEREHFIVSRKLDVTNHLVGKVLLQVAAPALLLLSCGVGAWSCGCDERRVVDVLRIHRRRRALHQHRLLRVRVVRDHGRHHDRHVPAFDHLAMSLSGLREEPQAFSFSVES